MPFWRRVHATDIPLNRFFFAHGPSVYIFYLFCAFLYAHFQQKTKTKTNVKYARGGAQEKKQTSFLTALVKNAKKPRRNEAKERIERRTSKKQKKTYIYEKN